MFKFDIGQKVKIDNPYSIFDGYIFQIVERRINEDNNMYLYRGAWFSEDELTEATPNNETLKIFFTEAMQKVQSYDLLHCDHSFALLLTASLYVKFKIEKRGSPLNILRETYKYGWMIPNDEAVQELSQRLLALMKNGEYNPPFLRFRSSLRIGKELLKES